MTSPGESSARSVWDRQSVWSQTANRLRARLLRARLVVLGLAVAAAVLAVAGSQVRQANAGWGRGLLFAAAVAAGLTPLVQSALSSQRVGDWIHARSISETLKAELYLYSPSKPRGPAQAAAANARRHPSSLGGQLTYPTRAPGASAPP